MKNDHASRARHESEHPGKARKPNSEARKKSELRGPNGSFSNLHHVPRDFLCEDPIFRVEAKLPNEPMRSARRFQVSNSRVKVVEKCETNPLLEIESRTPEIRKNPEGRGPNAFFAKRSHSSTSVPVPLRPVVGSEITKRTHYGGQALQFRVSDLGLPSVFGYSGFGFGFYQTNPCARRAGSGFRVRGSKLSKNAKRTHCWKSDRRRPEIRKKPTPETRLATEIPDAERFAAILPNEPNTVTDGSLACLVSRCPPLCASGSGRFSAFPYGTASHEACLVDLPNEAIFKER